MFISQHCFRRTLSVLFILLLPVSHLLAQKFTGDYTFTSLATGKVIEGSSSKVHVFSANKSEYSKWSIQPTDIRVGDKRTFSIRSVATGKCLDGDGGRLYVSDCNGGNYQTWLIEPTDKSGYVWITSVATGKVIDGDADKLYPGDRNGGDYQKWRMDRVVINTAPAAKPIPPGMVFEGFTLLRDNSLYSENKRYRLSLQNDGNLVLYRGDGVTSVSRWATGTNGKAVEKAVFQNDGNLVLYGYNGRPIWASNSNGKGGHYLFMQNDGNLVIYSTINKPIWASNTNE